MSQLPLWVEDQLGWYANLNPRQQNAMFLNSSLSSAERWMNFPTLSAWLILSMYHLMFGGARQATPECLDFYQTYMERSYSVPLVAVAGNLLGFQQTVAVNGQKSLVEATVDRAHGEYLRQTATGYVFWIDAMYTHLVPVLASVRRSLSDQSDLLPCTAHSEVMWAVVDHFACCWRLKFPCQSRDESWRNTRGYPANSRVSCRR